MEKIKLNPANIEEAARAIDYLYSHNKNYTKAQEEETTILYYLFFKGVHPYKEEEPATDPEAEKLQTIADKIYNFFAPWDIENATPAEIIEETRKHPLDTILFLLDYIENQ